MFRRLKVVAMIIALLLCASACTIMPQKEDARELQGFAGYEQIASYPNIFFETQGVGTDLEEIDPGWSYVYYNVQNKEIYFIDPLNCKAAILCKMYEPDGSPKKYSANNEERYIDCLHDICYFYYLKVIGGDYCDRTHLYEQKIIVDTETNVMYACISGAFKTSATPLYEPDGSLKLYNPNHEYSPLVVVNEDNASMNDDGVIYLYDPENYVMYSYTMDECGEVIRLLDAPKLYSPEGDEV